MKFRYLWCALAAASMVACGNKDNGGGGGSPTPGNPNGSQTAVTPQPCNNQGLPGAYSNCQSYQNYYVGQQSYNWQYGSWYWPTQYQPQIGNCGCNTGYNPIQGPYGTACAPSAYLTAYNSYGIVYIGGTLIGTSGYSGNYWDYGQNYGWVNRPQVPYTTPWPGANCGQVIAQGCDVRLNTCSAGARCQPVAGGSTLGLCVRY